MCADVKMVEAVKSVSVEVGGGVETQSQLLQSLTDWQTNKQPDSASSSNMK